MLRNKAGVEKLPDPALSAIPTIVAAELRTGVKKNLKTHPQQAGRLETFLKLFQLLDFDLEAALHYADIRAAARSGEDDARPARSFDRWSGSKHGSHPHHGEHSRIQTRQRTQASELEMTQANFDRFLEEQLRDPDFAKRFKQAGEAWDVALQLASLREHAGFRRLNSRAD